MCHVPCAMYHVPCVMYHVQCTMCHVPCAMYHEVNRNTVACGEPWQQRYSIRAHLYVPVAGEVGVRREAVSAVRDELREHFVPILLHEFGLAQRDACHGRCEPCSVREQPRRSLGEYTRRCFGWNKDRISGGISTSNRRILVRSPSRLCWRDKACLI